MSSEYGRLKAALLYLPGSEVHALADPGASLHQAPIDAPALRAELRALAAALREAGARVHRIPAGAGRTPNLMYVRDLFFSTPAGAVLARMGHPARAGEERHAERALRRLRVPVLARISGAGRFEGADALWLDPKAVVCGVGGRTNAEGLRQLRRALAAQGVETLSVPAPRGCLHLLGALQLLDRRLALLRAGIAGAPLRRLLETRGFRIIDVPESAEARERHGLNVVSVAPRRVILPEGCPGVERLLRRAGVRVAARVPAQQLVRGAGGLACATGIVARGEPA